MLDRYKIRDWAYLLLRGQETIAERERVKGTLRRAGNVLNVHLNLNKDMIFIDKLFYGIYKNTSKINKIYPVYYAVGLIVVVFYINFLTVFIFLNKFNEIYKYNIDKYYIIIVGVFCVRHFLICDKYISILNHYETIKKRNKFVDLFFDLYPIVSFIVYLVSLKVGIFIILGIFLLYKSIMFILDKLFN